MHSYMNDIIKMIIYSTHTAAIYAIQNPNDLYNNNNIKME